VSGSAEQNPDAVALPGLRIVGGSPSSEEVAAVTAVLTAALDAVAGERLREQQGQTAWQRSQRSIRTPLTPGAWTTFGV
jgi:collagenase-like PrtC family protease